MKFIDLDSQYRDLKSRIDERILAVLDSGQYVLGPAVGELEQMLADYVGVKHVIGCANGTDALTLSLLAHGVGPGDGVFVPTFTFFATAESVRLVGATPIFVDIDEATYNIDCDGLESAIGCYQAEGKLNLRGIIPVDLFGLPADYGRLEAIAKQHDLFIVEDGAQGFGATFDGRRVCSFGDIATTSFFPAKPLGAYGDGGAVFTNDDALAEKLRSLHVHGQAANKYDNQYIGLNSRLDTIQAAVLIEKLGVFDDELVRRNEAAAAYTERLSEHFITPVVPDGYTCCWAQYTVRAKEGDRASYQEKLQAAGIPSAVYYKTPMHQQPVFADMGYGKGSLPVSEKLSHEVFSLPMHPYLDEATIDRITSTLTQG
jgi:dTDP-4-amino-4,6-dideoxygalactose transaminase